MLNVILKSAADGDPHGLYKKARAGMIDHFTGLSSPYEAPEKPELVLKTQSASVEECVNMLYEYLRARFDGLM